jgi:hypothetical protein
MCFFLYKQDTGLVYEKCLGGYWNRAAHVLSSFFFVFCCVFQIIVDSSHDNMGFFKNKAMQAASELLIARPEQERALLCCVINKLGDSGAKIASNAAYSLSKVVGSLLYVDGMLCDVLGMFCYAMS